MPAKLIPLSTAPDFITAKDGTALQKVLGTLLDALHALGTFDSGTPIADATHSLGKAALGKRLDVTAKTDVTIALADDVGGEDKGGVVLLRNQTAGHTVTVTGNDQVTLTPTPVKLAPNESVLLTVDDAKKWSVLLHGSDANAVAATITAQIDAALKADGLIAKAVDSQNKADFTVGLNAKIVADIKAALGNQGDITKAVNVTDQNTFGAALKTMVDNAVKSGIAATFAAGGDIAKTIDSTGHKTFAAALIEQISAGHPPEVTAIVGALVKSNEFKAQLAAASTGGRKLLKVEKVSATPPDHIQFVLDDGDTSGYADYEIEFSNVTTDQSKGLYFVMQIAGNKGAKSTDWKIDSYALSQLEDRSKTHTELPTAEPDAELHAANAAALTLQGDLSNKVPGASISGRIRLVAPGNDKVHHHFLMDTISTLGTGEHVRTEGGGVYYKDTAAYNAVRLFYCQAGAPRGPEGKIPAGDFRLYGLTDKLSHS